MNQYRFDDGKTEWIIGDGNEDKIQEYNFAPVVVFKIDI